MRALLALGALQTRRVLGPVGVVVFVGIAWLLARGTTGASLPSVGDADAVRRASTWTVLLVLAAAWVVHGGAAVGRAWRERDRLWLGGGASARVALGGWLGGAAASAMLCGIAAVAAESSAAGGDGAVDRCVRRVPNPAAILTGEGASIGWSVDDPRGRLDGDGPRSVRFQLGVAPGSGPTARVELVARRGAAEERTELHVDGRTVGRVEVPDGDGPLELEVRTLGAGCTVVLGADTAWLLAPAGRAAAPVAVALRGLAFLATWSAVGVAAGAWLGVGVATWLALALALATSSASPVPSLASLGLDAGLLEAVALAGDSLAIGPPTAAELARLGGTVLVALALAQVGMRSGTAGVEDVA